jgi:hypothetical protein
LYGWETWITSSTPPSDSSRSAFTLPSLPTSPTAVRCFPGMGRASYPISVITSTTACTCSALASCLITISMADSGTDLRVTADA